MSKPKPKRHCKVWNFNFAALLYQQGCPHCGWIFEEFETQDEEGDYMRAQLSQSEHAKRCDGRYTCGAR